MSERQTANWARLKMLVFPAFVVAGGLALVGAAGEGPFDHTSGTDVRPGMVLTSGTCGGSSFCISSSSPGPVLYPGAAASNLPLAFWNPLNVPLNVFSLTVSFANTNFPAKCDPTALLINGSAAKVTNGVASWSVSFPTGQYFSVPRATGSGNGTSTYPATLALADKGNQDTCKNLTLSMSYTAAAYYTVTTSTALKVTTSPVLVDQPLAFQATVTPTVSPSSPGQTPVGSVQFYQCTSSTGGCTNAIGSATPLNGSAVATTTTTFNTQGPYYLEVVFTPTDSTNFSSSSSSIQSVSPGYTTVISGSQNGGLTVGSGQTVEVTSGGKVNGSVTVNSGGALVVNGGTVNGGVTASSGSTRINLCRASINGGVTVSYATGPVVIGNPPGCTGNTIRGGLTVTYNTGGVTVNGNNVTGGVTVSNNSGPTSSSVQYAGGNTISGGLTCSANLASLSNGGKPNSASGSRSGQCAGSF